MSVPPEQKDLAPMSRSLASTVVQGIRAEMKATRRVARNLVLKGRPLFGHFYVTQRCNLKCDYCQAWEKMDMKELDTAATCRLVDVLDDIGIGVLSLTGGEPLTRPDIFEVIDHAKARGLYTKITSNGTMPRRDYERLLKTEINQITISLDGIEGNDLPRSKVGPKILETIEWLHQNRGEKAVSIATLLYERNRDQVEGVLDYINGRYPKMGVFVQPVVVGAGDFRRSNQRKVDPSFLRDKETLAPDYFIDACVEYYKRDRFTWDCQAGTLFFDIKPNGDFWICQDIGTDLNMLDPDFRAKWRALDLDKLRAPCPGCIYSCYYLTQAAFSWKRFPRMVKTYAQTYLSK
jgi:MoaA/NifB/PqqE/SkfB family radical SAM enzyme